MVILTYYGITLIGICIFSYPNIFCRNIFLNLIDLAMWAAETQLQQYTQYKKNLQLSHTLTEWTVCTAKMQYRNKITLTMHKQKQFYSLILKGFFGSVESFTWQLHGANTKGKPMST